MGETICNKCGNMNWHIYCHAFGKCELCGSPVTFCDSCLTPINPKGERWALDLLTGKLNQKLSDSVRELLNRTTIRKEKC
jgi:hypothetical protein